MNEQGLLALLIENIQFSLRHPNYLRTLEVRDFSHMVSTGDGQDDEVQRYRRFEDEELKDQRLRLYNSQTEALINSLRKNWKRMARVEGIRETWETPNLGALELLKQDFYNFMPGESLNDWLNRMLEHLGVTDPNAWIVYERADERSEEGQIIQTKVWPFIVPSVDALNFEHRYGRLEWFLCRTTEIERVIRSGMVRQNILENFYLYAPGLIIRAREVGEKTTAESDEVQIPIEVFPQVDGQSYSDETIAFHIGGGKQRTFYVKVIRNGTTEVPALIAGAYMDEITGHETRVPWFQPGAGILRDLIKLKSSLDVTLTVHTYPRRWEFVKPCRFSDPEMGECVGGFLNDMRDDEHRCPACGGSGKAANFTTEQEVMQLVMPDTPEAIMELGKLSFTEPVDITLPSLLQDLLDKRERQFIQAIFSADSHQKPDTSGAMTAFEVAKINEGVHDALVTFGKQYSRHWELAYRVGCQYRGIPLVSCDHSFPEDLQIETLDELLARFGQARSVGVGYDVVTAIRQRIQQKVFEGSPKLQKAIQEQYKFLPFDDKSPEEVAMILAGRSPLDEQRILRENWREIFLEINDEYPAFADMTYQKQSEIVREKVGDWRERILLADQSPDALTQAEEQSDEDQNETNETETENEADAIPESNQ